MTTPCSYKINDHNGSNNPIIMLIILYILCVSVRFIINLICKYTGMFKPKLEFLWSQIKCRFQSAWKSAETLFSKLSTEELDKDANILVPIDSGDQREFLMTVVRHGMATYANEGDGKALTDLGEKEAEKVGLRLANINFDLIICSHLDRARETAEFIIKENKCKNKQLTICKDVREIDSGPMQPIIAWMAKFPIFLYIVRSFYSNPVINILGGGESVDDLKERIRQFLLNLQLAVNDLGVENPQVLVVSHGGFLRVMHNVLTGETPETYGNTAVTQYQLKGVHRAEDGTWGVEHVECLMLLDATVGVLKSSPGSTSGVDRGSSEIIDEVVPSPPQSEFEVDTISPVTEVEVKKSPPKSMDEVIEPK